EFLNPDGSITAEIFSQPIHWKNKHGKWEEINNTIVPSSEVSSLPFKNGSNNIETFFAKNLKNQAVSRIRWKDNSIEFIPQNTELTTGIPKGNKITYQKIYPSVDMQYTVLSTGMKEDITLSDNSAPNTFTFAMKLQGLTPKAHKDGSIGFYDKQEVERFRSTKPYATDSKEALTENVTSSIRQEGKQWYLDITLDQDWLKDPSRAFPVTIDPTVTFWSEDSAQVKDTFTAANYPTTPEYAKTFLTTGNNSVYGTSRAFLWFNLPSIPSGANVQSAQLQLNQITSQTNTDTAIDVHRVLSAWSDTSLTWSNQPSYDTTAVGSIANTTMGAWPFDVSSLVKDWYNAKYANYGFMLKARDETTNRGDSVHKKMVIPRLTRNW
ncbi:DNRLRE domain-containing protein, partial [Aneurinibacillus tyrosinisolvens]|uniref:DNRLRE domain-containing protein n=1 Tax=Aneurinibacillus tyrosinisolvens TaxID=1443435 RepID=UPI00063F6B8A